MPRYYHVEDALAMSNLGAYQELLLTGLLGMFFPRVGFFGVALVAAMLLGWL